MTRENGSVGGHRQPIKLYADPTPRRMRQIVADVLMGAWIPLCHWLGRAVSERMEGLRRPADNLASAGGSIRDNMSGAASNVGGVPVVGDSLRGPFDAVSRAGQNIANVGASLGMTVDQVSSVVSVVVAVVPILAVLAVWAVVRIRFGPARDRSPAMDGSARRSRALRPRALSRQPLRRLERVGPDPAGGFRDGDRTTLRALADLELDRCGLTPKTDEEWLGALPA
ncbi:MAG TPA: hypothetical protein VNS83_09005 [Lapillicoccus sp.]|nr:hypothetical protein [Lapillicoccus sp.]